MFWHICPLMTLGNLGLGHWLLGQHVGLAIPSDRFFLNEFLWQVQINISFMKKVWDRYHTLQLWASSRSLQQELYVGHKLYHPQYFYFFLPAIDLINYSVWRMALELGLLCLRERGFVLSSSNFPCWREGKHLKASESFLVRLCIGHSCRIGGLRCHKTEAALGNKARKLKKCSVSSQQKLFVIFPIFFLVKG